MKDTKLFKRKIVTSIENIYIIDSMPEGGLPKKLTIALYILYK